MQFNLSKTFYNDLLTGKHNFAADTIRVTLTDDIAKRGQGVEVAAKVNGGTVSLEDTTVTADTDITFRYIVVYNAKSNANVGHFDYGEPAKLRAGDQMNVTLGEVFRIK